MIRENSQDSRIKAEVGDVLSEYKSIKLIM